MGDSMLIHERDYSKSILEEVQKLHGAVRGTGDSLPDERLLEIVQWLETQVEIEWIPSTECSRVYDDAVRELARAAIEEGKRELKLSTMMISPSST
jgi:hypothetical protein